MPPPPVIAWRRAEHDSKPPTKKRPHPTLSDFLFVPSDVADALPQFDLCGCKLHRVEVLMENRKTSLPGHCCVLDFYRRKDVVLPDQSLAFPSRGGALALQGSALAVAIRVALGALFVSDRRGQALRLAGVDKPVSRRRCRMV